MQMKQFSNGGFVLHKVTLTGYKGHFSAWFDKDSRILDAEQVFPGQRFGSRNVKRGGPAWDLLLDTGKQTGAFLPMLY